MINFPGGWRSPVERPGGNPCRLWTLLLNVFTDYMEIEGWKLSDGFKKQMDIFMQANL